MINQVVGPLARELMEHLSACGIRCRALTGWVDARERADLPFEVLKAKPLVKRPAWKRLWSWGLFTAQAKLAAIRLRRTPMLVTTNPPWPMLAMPMLKRLTGLRYVLLVYDIYPDVMEQMGLCRHDSLLARLWRRWSRKAMLKAEGVITLGPHMAATLRRHLREGEDVAIETIPNWADTDFIRPLDKADNPFAREHGLTDKFVVAYSGALGATHDIDSIIAAAEMLNDLPDVQFLIIGEGTRRAEIEALVAKRNLPNLKLLPFQPLERVPYSLAAADCLIVCLGEGYEGLSVPSKTYYALAAGAAVLAISPKDTELTDLVEQFACGLHVPPRSGPALAEAIRRLRSDGQLLANFKAASRKAAEEHFSRKIVTERYRRYLAECFAPPADR
jgi:glycosyltransferase involved in cell wall biosynthesis